LQARLFASHGTFVHQYIASSSNDRRSANEAKTIDFDSHIFLFWRSTRRREHGKRTRLTLVIQKSSNWAITARSASAAPNFEGEGDGGQLVGVTLEGYSFINLIVFLYVKAR
jgi:hypothetical protein